MKLQKFDIYLIPLILFLILTLYFYKIGAKNPLEYAFIIFGTQLIVSYFFIFVGEILTHKKSGKYVWLILFIVFITYNFIFFHYEGIEKLDTIVENVRNVNIDFKEEKFSGFFTNLATNYRKSDYFAPENKYTCNTVSDCNLSLTDPKAFQLCVNSKYLKLARKKTYDLKPDPTLECMCKNNFCVRSDYKIESVE